MKRAGGKCRADVNDGWSTCRGGIDVAFASARSPIPPDVAVAPRLTEPWCERFADYLAERVRRPTKRSPQPDCLKLSGLDRGTSEFFGKGEVAVDIKARLQITNGFRHQVMRHWPGGRLVNGSALRLSPGYRGRALCKPCLSNYKTHPARHLVWRAPECRQNSARLSILSQRSTADFTTISPSS